MYRFKVFLDGQSFCSQGTVPIRDTPLMASFHVPRWHFGLGYVFSVCDTRIWWKKPVSRAGNRGKTCHFDRDTDFCEDKGVSRLETWLDDRKTARDTQFNAEKGVSLHVEHACTPQRYDKPPQPYSRYRLLCGKRCVAA